MCACLELTLSWSTEPNIECFVLERGTATRILHIEYCGLFFFVFLSLAQDRSFFDGPIDLHYWELLFWHPCFAYFAPPLCRELEEAEDKDDACSRMRHIHRAISRYHVM